MLFHIYTQLFTGPPSRDELKKKDTYDNMAFKETGDLNKSHRGEK
jgi:hypothetical protein